MITFNKEKDIQELLTGITKLAPENIIALAKVLDVKLSTVDPETGEYSIHDGEKIVADIVNAFRTLKHKERKIVLKAVKNSGSRS